jgi:hypothetical protein
MLAQDNRDEWLALKSATHDQHCRADEVIE